MPLSFPKDGLQQLTLPEIPEAENVRTVAYALRDSPRVHLAQTMLTSAPTGAESGRRPVTLRRGVLMVEPAPKRFLVQQANLAVDLFATQPALLATLKSITKLDLEYYGGHIWVALVPPPQYRPFLSQTWHRDPYDGGGQRVVKVFWYLEDVDRGNGPFEYIAGSRELEPPTGLSAMDRYAPARNQSELDAHPRRVVCTGPRDTVLVCDTSGIHRGGLCTLRRRLSVTLVYSA